MAHANVNPKLSSAVKAVVNGMSSFAHTQALWRFLGHDGVDLPTLRGPAGGHTAGARRVGLGGAGLVDVELLPS